MNRRDLRRIEALAIPPAWTDVWICDDEWGHLQATGRDARGRKQYRYHSLWREIRDGAKFDRLLEFGEALPRIRKRVDRDLKRPSLDRERVLAVVVAVLDETLLRVGNPRYAKDNESFGLTTLTTHHAEIGSTRVRLRFRGKSGKEIAVSVDNPRIARAFKRLAELPGQELLQYVDGEGQVRAVGSADVNAYLRAASGAEITSKDFRTWGGTVTAARSLHAAAHGNVGPRRDAVASAIREAAAVLGNTPAVCRRSYVHPAIIELYNSGRLEDVWERARRCEPRRRHLDNDERILLGVLRTAGSQTPAHHWNSAVS